MYYTLTFNPALDYIVNLSSFSEGKLNRTTSEIFLPGGKGINVSTVLSSFGVENTALGFVAGFTGRELERILKEKKIKTDFIYLPSGNTRVNVKIKSSLETEINAKGPEIDKKSIEQLFGKLDVLKDGDFLVLSGNVPSSLSETIYSDIAEYLSIKKVNLIIDAEKNLLLPALKFKPFLIKPNLAELEEIYGQRLFSEKEILEASLVLHKMGARNIFVSLGADGGLFVTEKKEVYSSPAPKGQLINSTGAGDSCIAGFLAQYKKEKNLRTAFIMGLCTGSASAFSEELATREEAEKLYRHHII